VAGGNSRPVSGYNKNKERPVWRYKVQKQPIDKQPLKPATDTMYRRALAIPIAAILVPIQTNLHKQPPEYLNRIRRYSHPKKVFSTFASTYDTDTKQPCMTADDFINAILYTHPMQKRQSEFTEKQEKAKEIAYQGIRDIIQTADVDGDGGISYEEYSFFMTLLSSKAHSSSYTRAMMYSSHSMQGDIH